ncbi:unnamed protein product [Brassicogethes aeneus]|uniref:Regulatory protein zeste n=1 Tax=Brassicogethes aeneus TaxID=1431903 RepID=A0A9P0FM87_BRAAE|nr:unnamed protein product [Brassicogethes aeneus]
MAQQKWINIAGELHQTVGVIKDWKAWRKTWQYLCSRAKQKKSRINNSKNDTGGGPTEILTPFEKKIVHLIGHTAIEGHTEVLESEVINFLENTTAEFIYMEFDANEPMPSLRDPSPVGVVNQPPIPTMQPANSDHSVHETPTSRKSYLGKRKNNNENIPTKQPT